MLPILTRIPGFRRLWRRFPVGPLPLRAEYDIWWEHPAYGYGVYNAAWLGRALGLDGLTVMEWGVVTGAGLVDMERIAAEVGRHFGMRIVVAGFDTGKGLPPPIDYRDGAHLWGEGFYRMDEEQVRSRLSSAELVVGPLAESLAAFLARPGLPPVGFVAINLDYYSLAKEGLRQVAALPPSARLPRVYCLFDDILKPERACYNEWFGELLAIREFNAEREMMKLAKIPHLTWQRRHPNFWNETMYVLHDFQHPLYTRLITPEGHAYRQL